MKSKFLVAVLILTMTGCGVQEQMNTLDSVNASRLSYDVPQCQVPLTDYQFSVSLLNFEMTDKAGFSAGFDILKGIFKAFGVKFNAERGTLSSTMSFAEASNPRQPIASTNVFTSKNTLGINASAELIKAGLSFDYYYSTPIGYLTQKALEQGLWDIKYKLDRQNLPWSTTVAAVSGENQIIVPVGTVAGLSVGDQFEVYNVETKWLGEPCASALVSRQLSATPVAVVKVASARDQRPMATVLTITQSNGVIKQGAQVFVKKTRNRNLLRSVQIGSLKSGPIMIDEKTSLDILGYLSQQIQGTLDAYGFYLRN